MAEMEASQASFVGVLERGGVGGRGGIVAGATTGQRIARASCGAMLGAPKTICAIWPGEAGEKFEEVVEEGQGVYRARRSVLRDAFDAGREAMKRERDVFMKRDRS